MTIAEHEARFTYLVMALVENVAKPDEIAEFRALLRQYPEFKLQYLEQMRLHGLMVRRQAMSRTRAACGGAAESGIAGAAVTAGAIAVNGGGADRCRRLGVAGGG